MRILIALAIIAAGGASAQHANHTNHGMPTGHSPESPLSEPGQDMFAALTEVVSNLRVDPKTDWTKVDLVGLRTHLLDMDLVVRDAIVTTEETPTGLRFKVDLSGRVGEAARRMVPAHASVLQKETGWKSNVTDHADYVIWTVENQKNSQRIKALGFFGLMATGDHHRDHHWALARGEPAH